MSNSHWYHFFHDAFGVIRSKTNFFLGARYALWSLRGGGGGGGHVPLLPPPPLGSGTDTGGFLLLQNFSVAISVSPYVCFILVLILISMFLR